MLPVDNEEEDYSLGDLETPVPAAMGNTPIVRTLRVPIGLAGQRLDQALAELLPDYSRSRLSVMVKDGAILVDQRRVQPKTKLLGGESIEARLTPREEESAFQPEDVPLAVIMRTMQ